MMSIWYNIPGGKNIFEKNKVQLWSDHPYGFDDDGRHLDAKCVAKKNDKEVFENLRTIWEIIGNEKMWVSERKKEGGKDGCLWSGKDAVSVVFRQVGVSGNRKWFRAFANSSKKVCSFSNQSFTSPATWDLQNVSELCSSLSTIRQQANEQRRAETEPMTLCHVERGALRGCQKLRLET